MKIAAAPESPDFPKNSGAQKPLGFNYNSFWKDRKNLQIEDTWFLGCPNLCFSLVFWPGGQLSPQDTKNAWSVWNFKKEVSERDGSGEHDMVQS